ncbi:hypothetical protein [Pseudomonas sp. RIT-PI-AD]|uniref:hypothetical protein n=1 Tax=Pseudomonas sp. RIT-PI-AD TaxID=3035294 RepID=UPI0021DAB620|nr:hypothetical protein [Pseudomonas sp. RIT-PI-AD]
MNLTREQILAAKRRQEVVAVPEWSGEVILSALSLRERGEQLAELFALAKLESGNAEYAEANRQWQLRLLARSITDAEGQALFSIEDVDTLAKADPLPLGRIADAAVALNGFVPNAAEEHAKK